MQLFARKKITQNNLNTSPLTIESGASVYVYAIHIFQDSSTSASGSILTVATVTDNLTMFLAHARANENLPITIPFIADKGLTISANNDNIGVSVYYSQVG